MAPGVWRCRRIWPASPALPCWATSTDQELNEMPTCNIRHEPGSDAQKKCAVHGRRVGRRVAASLTPPMLRQKTPEAAIPELPADVAEGLLRSRAQKGYSRDASVERLAEIVSDTELSTVGVKYALVDEGFEDSVARATLVSQMVRG